jgi:molybdopterin guanine dinucleotide-containing S/N-oxide reductase-like protein
MYSNPFLSRSFVKPYFGNTLKEKNSMAEKKNVTRAKGVVAVDKTVLKSAGLGGVHGGGAPVFVDVKDGRIMRVRPFHYDWKYDMKSFNPWKFERNGVKLEPLAKTLIGPFSLAYKKRTYSPNRIKYPLKRIDWNPEGDRNTQNRGKSKFVRISWDEAATLVASEIKRIHKKYGPLGVLMQGDGHGECKTINTPHGQSGLLLDKMGGFTQQVRNPDSWEGWYWGSKHVWGQGTMGMQHPTTNVVKDITENSDMVIFQGCDPETTPWGFVGQFASRLCYFWRDAGIKQVYICPDVNYGCAVHADKWIPILPNTDAALQLAIIYTWIKEGSYKKDYIKTHTVGFDKIKDYVLGKVDGEPKTPAWATKKCGVPEWTIKALARDWAKKKVSLAHYFGGSYVRGPFSHEPARLECVLLAMQGLGGPGVWQTQITYGGMPRPEGIKPNKYTYSNLALGERLTIPIRTTTSAWGKQLIPKTLIHKAIQLGKAEFYGNAAFESSVEDQFKRYQYPIEKEKGGTEIHMIWSDTPCRITCWNCGNETIEAMRSEKIETVVVQHPWLENDTLYADIILPSNTLMEVDDIVTHTRQGVQFQQIALQEKAIEPIGESKSDYEVVVEIAKKLGMEKEVTGGLTIPDLQKTVFDNMGTNAYISWEEFKEKKYWVYPCAKDWQKDVCFWRKFYEDPENNPAPTPTGKLEIFSQALADAFPNDKERPPYPRWIEKSEMHDERRGGSRAKMFPLLVVANHPRWRTHAQADDIPWTREAFTCKVKGWDGYWYEPCWINPQDAAARDIKTGDIVKVFNERGIVLCGALVMERIMPGVTYVDHGARHDPILPGKIDRGGAIDTISCDWITSKNCVGEATSGFLVDVRKVTIAQMEEWRRLYPDAFNREYSGASGLCFNAWVEDGHQDTSLR